MANPEHLKVLRHGVEAWNKWRLANLEIIPDLVKADLLEADLIGADLIRADLSEANLSLADLSGADFSRASLNGADLSRAKLTGANLSRAKLTGANLSHAVLNRANLSGVELSEADLSGASLPQADLRGADLSGSDLSRANLTGADLRSANLAEADLTRAILMRSDLKRADLGGANLTQADLTEADLTLAVLSGADLTGAILVQADLERAVLSGADFDGAGLLGTVMANTDLGEVKELESVIHHGPSSIGIDTFFRSGGKIPEVFLRGAGVPETFIRYAASLVGVPLEFYSCFISYSTEDEEFATRLHNDFQAKGIRCWKWDHDARTGRSLWDEIDKAIRVYDKLVLIASESSLKSPAVNREIERALIQEDQRLKRKLAGDSNADCDVLFPVRLDDFIFKGWDHERKVDVTKKVIADACGWANDPALYRRVLERLLRDLKSEKSKPDPSAK
jgi:uncharacterized protein YjbI with pentapeptide repeats